MFVNYLTIPNRLARLGLGYMIRALQRKLYRNHDVRKSPTDPIYDRHHDELV